MSTRSNPQPATSRRARRAADRRAAAAAAQAKATPTWRQSPLLWITALIGGIGVVALVGVILLQGSAPKVDATGLITPTVSVPAGLADGRSLGKADAPVTLTVWSDFQCPVCGEFLLHRADGIGCGQCDLELGGASSAESLLQSDVAAGRAGGGSEYAW